MNTRRLSFLLLLFLSAPVSVHADHEPGTGIRQTSHDLSIGGVGGAYVGTTPPDELDRICIFCHAPHNAISARLDPAGFSRLSYYPLWNHGVTTIATFQTYTSGPDQPNMVQHQLNARISRLQPGASSLLCLSCHDGSVAINVYGYNALGSFQSYGGPHASGRILIGDAGDLQNHHPIGFDYNVVASVDDELYPANTLLRGQNPYGLTINDLLVNGRMECITCHDVHNTKNEGAKFTWVSDYRSDFCLSCHRK